MRRAYQKYPQIILQNVLTITKRNHKTGQNGVRNPESRSIGQSISRSKKDILLADAEFKGYRHMIKQNIKFETDNVEYILERFYSPGENKVYEAKLPTDVRDYEFGSDLKAFIANIYYSGRVTEKKILKILKEIGIAISIGQISNILTKDKKDEFAAEKQDIFESGMEQARYFHTDNTGARHRGTNYYAHVVCA